MRRKFVIAFSFTQEFEEESVAEAMASAVYGLKYGTREPQGLALSVEAELPIEPAKEEAPQPPKEFADADSGLPPVTAQDEGIPF